MEWLLYIYLSGIIIVALMIAFIPWLRPKHKVDWNASILLLILSWLSIVVYLYVVYDGWKINREIMKEIKDLPDEEE